MERLADGVTGIVMHGMESRLHDLVTLRRYLTIILDLLAEKASEAEPGWPAIVASAAEIETLLEVEVRIAEKTAEWTAGSLGEVMQKLAIWELLASEDEEAGAGCLGNVVVRSVIDDLRGLRASA